MEQACEETSRGSVADPGSIPGISTTQIVTLSLGDIVVLSGYDDRMSATTENLLEEIKSTERALQDAKSPAEASTHIERLRELRLRLASANEALNEGRQVLKD